MREWKRCWPIAVLLIAILFIWPLTGCDKYTRYKVLNFFFDGVPHPDGEPKKGEPVAVSAKAEKPTRAEQPQQAVLHKHPPAEGKDDCSFCHGPVNRMVLPSKDICLKCHEHVKDKRPFIHGPAAVDCVVCHNVHESQVKTLLKKVGNMACFECHDKEGIQKTEPHKEMKEDELVCLSCHDPHGGKDKFFLK
jgi:predicted CXXCH cytochrome family protein